MKKNDSYFYTTKYSEIVGQISQKICPDELIMLLKIIEIREWKENLMNCWINALKFKEILLGKGKSI